MGGNEIEVVRIGRDNYDEFCRMIEWRVTGKEGADISKYKEAEQKEFFERYGTLNSDRFFIFAAKEDYKFIGWITAVLIQKPDPRLGVLYVDELWVGEEYRNRGAAAKLMEKVFKVAKEMKLWKVRLYVSADNEAGRGFYKKMGFSENDYCYFSEVAVRDIAE